MQIRTVEGRRHETTSPPICLHYRLPAQSEEGRSVRQQRDNCVRCLEQQFHALALLGFQVQLHENILSYHPAPLHPRPTHWRFSTKLSGLTRQLLLPPLAQSSYSDSRPQSISVSLRDSRGPGTLPASRRSTLSLPPWQRSLLLEENERTYNCNEDVQLEADLHKETHNPGITFCLCMTSSLTGESSRNLEAMPILVCSLPPRSIRSWHSWAPSLHSSFSLTSQHQVKQSIANLPANWSSSAGHDLFVHPQLHNWQRTSGLHLEAGFDFYWYTAWSEYIDYTILLITLVRSLHTTITPPGNRRGIWGESLEDQGIIFYRNDSHPAGQQLHQFISW